MKGKLNILYCPQISMYDKQTGKLTPEADGNVNMMRNTILEWHNNRPDDKFYVLLPAELQGKSILKILPNITPIFINSYVVSARINRYNFPMNEIVSLLYKDLKFDLLINDVIELTGNFKQMFKINFGYEPKIISNIRHVDEGGYSDYIYRVIDGIKQSDITTILSESMKKKLIRQITNAGLGYGYTDEMLYYGRMTVFEPSISYDEIMKYRNMCQIKDLRKAIITFPGRLSIGEEKRTNWDKFQEAILKLREERQDFEVYFTDPNNAMEIKDVDWIHTIPKDRDTFLRLLLKTDIVVSLMNVEGFGGISIREALLMGCLPVIPYVDEYKSMAPEGYHGFAHEMTVEELVYRLEWAIDVVVNKNKSKFNLYPYAEKFTIENQFENLLKRVRDIF